MIVLCWRGIAKYVNSSKTLHKLKVRDQKCLAELSFIRCYYKTLILKIEEKIGKYHVIDYVNATYE